MSRSQANVVSNAASVMSPFMLGFWALLLSLSWLLPVHFPPWVTFPADAWAALLFVIAAGGVTLRTRSVVSWHAISGLAASLVFLPWLQLSWGLIPYAGQAWISSAYLLGFLLALLIGARWEAASPDQAPQGLFMGVGVASVASVGMQLYAWLGLASSGALGVLALDGAGARPYANLGQPNQLATLLLWGLLSFFWAYLRGRLRASVTLLAAVFLLLGLALTQSRAGFLSLAVMTAAAWFWRGLWPSRRVPIAVSCLLVYALVLPSVLGWLQTFLLLGQGDVLLRIQQQGELRLRAWRLFLQAVLERPVLGYGWTEVGVAQLAVSERFPSLNGLFQMSHNLFLDLVLWAGVPIGLLLTAMLLMWFWKCLRAIDKPGEATLLMLLITVAVHALVEYPLQYAYFLLPTGLVMGVLNTRLGSHVRWTSPYWVLPVLCLTAATMLCVTAWDYAKVDRSYAELRLEQSLVGQGKEPDGSPPDVLVLSHLREWIVVARYRSRAGMSQQELDNMTTMATYYPGASLMYRLAVALVLNGRPLEAQAWLAKICKITDEGQCLSGQRRWAKDVRMVGVRWPGTVSADVAPD